MALLTEIRTTLKVVRTFDSSPSVALHGDKVSTC
jgi:hypothetical protein